ncbi:unnamed protein product [Lampetra planeri]
MSGNLTATLLNTTMLLVQVTYISDFTCYHKKPGVASSEYCRLICSNMARDALATGFRGSFALDVSRVVNLSEVFCMMEPLTCMRSLGPAVSSRCCHSGVEVNLRSQRRHGAPGHAAAASARIRRMKRRSRRRREAAQEGDGAELAERIMVGEELAIHVMGEAVVNVTVGTVGPVANGTTAGTIATPGNPGRRGRRGEGGAHARGCRLGTQHGAWWGAESGGGKSYGAPPPLSSGLQDGTWVRLWSGELPRVYHSDGVLVYKRRSPALAQASLTHKARTADEEAACRVEIVSGDAPWGHESAAERGKRRFWLPLLLLLRARTPTESPFWLLAALLAEERAATSARRRGPGERRPPPLVNAVPGIPRSHRRG